MFREIDSKTQNISVLYLKKLYFMFLKCKQTQLACVKNEHTIDYIQNSSSDSWNQTSQKSSTFLDIHFRLFIIVQYDCLFIIVQ